MKGNLYYSEAEAEVAILGAAYQALITDMEIAAGLENELKSVRARVDQRLTPGNDVLRGIARYCEAWDSVPATSLLSGRTGGVCPVPQVTVSLADG